MIVPLYDPANPVDDSHTNSSVLVAATVTVQDTECFEPTARFRVRGSEPKPKLVPSTVRIVPVAAGLSPLATNEIGSV